MKWWNCGENYAACTKMKKAGDGRRNSQPLSAHRATPVLGVDSGAAVSVIPSNVCVDHPGRSDRDAVFSDGGEVIRDLGRREMWVCSRNATLSVFDMCSNGHPVVFNGASTARNSEKVYFKLNNHGRIVLCHQEQEK